MLTVDFQAMLDMDVCPDCHGAKLRKESLHVMLDASHYETVAHHSDAGIRKHGTTDVLRNLFRS